MKLARSARRGLGVLVALALSVGVSGLASASEREDMSARAPAPGELALETRLLAPCCWQGTLDAHESESAQALRMEIRARLYAGEAPEALEASIVRQYGERIRASSPRDPLRFVAAGVLVLTAAAAFGLWRVMRRWQRTATRSLPVAPVAPVPPDAYDKRLDDELSAIE